MKKGSVHKKHSHLILLLLAVSLLGGCMHKEPKIRKIQDLDFEILTVGQVDSELSQMIEEKKRMPFRFTYEDDGMLYICIGYGEKPSGGYSITVDELMEAENAVYVNTSLIGPDNEDVKVKGTSYPNLIIRTKDIDKAVVFE